MDYFPLFHRFNGQKVLVVGGGTIALRKITLLEKSGASIHVVAKEVHAEIQAKASCTCEQREYKPEDLNDCALVVVATDNSALNKEVSDQAKAKGLLVNVVDSPDLCNCIFPSIVDRNPLIVAITSSGQAPVLARSIRAKLESTIPASYGQLAQLASKFRSRVKAKFSRMDDRLSFWEKVLNGVIAEHVYAGRLKQAEASLEAELNNPKLRSRGEVYLVGAGPGDPDLLTFKALRLMQQADVVLYDALVSPQIMELVRRDAERVYVGKRRANHALPQEQINQQLLDLALEGKRVLRLKGGDPFIFGRGGEEIDLLAEHNVPFQVVPGITAASGCASYSGIPLTHRDYAQSVRFVTGHLKDGTMNLPWKELVVPAQTLVFYMGLAGINTICEEMIKHGRHADTPMALIQKGTTPEQRVIIGTLGTMPEIVLREKPQAPTLTIVGEVVSLHSHLNWFQA
ncbi:siroheme synthase CysG [Reinekea marinisedimentorum]|uniref:Siroheme synthase n=1 Tax=Reinekea marinisedimentorum TaxID=230495 RepID=A0A4R3IAN6_9GAMM|nr:siroheme synthase CysG [Reinekea marinisedimentorum]TCS42490.1 uroporphyrin-III C-methyltransferase/precorrin-2 dehydrogenase/sirohydrochlorin ferrochelatase [Reinekea marinisedimentorum]